MELHVIETVILSMVKFEESLVVETTLQQIIARIHPEGSTSFILFNSLEEWDCQFLLRLLRSNAFESNLYLLETLLHRMVSMDKTVCCCHALERVLQFFAEEEEDFTSYYELMDPVVQAVIEHFPHCTNNQYRYKVIYFVTCYTKEKSKPLIPLLEEKEDSLEEMMQPGGCWRILAAVNLANEMKDSSLLCRLGVCCECSPQKSLISILSACDKTLLLYLSLIMRIGLYERESGMESHLDVYAVMFDFLDYIDSDLEVIAAFFSESIHIIYVILYLTKILNYDFYVSSAYTLIISRNKRKVLILMKFSTFWPICQIFYRIWKSKT